MPKQKSIFKVQGTMGDVSFIKTQDGYGVKEKSAISADKFANDPAFARTRENAAEFGNAGKAGKLLRTAFRKPLQNGKDSRMVSRLTKAMMRVVKSDAINFRGQRNVIDGDTLLLQGFEFNINAVLNATLFAGYTPAIDRDGGKLSINVQSFVPMRDLAVPEGSTHCKLVSAAAEIDFATGIFVASEALSATIPLNGNTVDAFTLENTVTPKSTHPLFLVLGIQFFQQVNGVDYPLKNEAFNALSLIQVDKS